MTPLDRVLVWASILFEAFGAIFLAAPLTWSMFLVALCTGAAMSHELLEQRGMRAAIFGMISGAAFGVFIAARGLA